MHLFHHLVNVDSSQPESRVVRAACYLPVPPLGHHVIRFVPRPAIPEVLLPLLLQRAGMLIVEESQTADCLFSSWVRCSHHVDARHQQLSVFDSVE